MDNYFDILTEFRACNNSLSNFQRELEVAKLDHLAPDIGKSISINDHAYFCLFFFQLEIHIKSSFTALCRHRLKMTEGPDHVAWATIAQRKPDIIGMAEILLAKKPELIALLKRLYKDRNAIAHEGQVALSFQITSAMEDIELIAFEIERLPDLEAAP